jgi:hypothetical protein
MAEPHPFRRAAEAKDLDLLRECLTEDIVLHSPILFRGFEGRDVAAFVLQNVIEVLEGFRYVDELAGEDTVTLRFKANVGDLEIEGIDFLELAPDGRVREMTVFLRPLKAVHAFNDKMAPRLGAAPPA